MPDPGGLYDQSPILLDEWTKIAQAENQAEAKRQKDEQSKQNQASKGATRSTRRSPRPRRR